MFYPGTQMLFQQGSLYRFSCSNILRAFCFESVYENIGKNHCNITAFKSKFFFFFLAKWEEWSKEFCFVLFSLVITLQYYVTCMCSNLYKETSNPGIPNLPRHGFFWRSQLQFLFWLEEAIHLVFPTSLYRSSINLVLLLKVRALL